MRRLSLRTTIIAVIVLIVVLSQFDFFNPVRDGFRRVLSVPILGLDSLTGRISDAFRVLFTVNDLAKENLTLKQENTALQAEIANLKAVESENAKLRLDLNFKTTHPELTLTPAQVISFSPTGLYQSLVINLGSDNRVKEGQAVVSGGYLIGKISNVSRSTAEVWLLSNRNLITPVSLAGSQTVGLLTGGIRGLVVENIPLDTKVVPGEAVVTSALEGLYPAGIAVGSVAEIISLREEIFLTLRVTSPIALGGLRTVFVVDQ